MPTAFINFDPTRLTLIKGVERIYGVVHRFALREDFGGSTLPVRTISTSAGTYLRWLQLPMRIVRLLFMAIPLKKNELVADRRQ